MSCRTQTSKLAWHTYGRAPDSRATEFKGERTEEISQTEKENAMWMEPISAHEALREPSTYSTALPLTLLSFRAMIKV